MADGFKIDKSQIDKLTRELNREIQRSARRNIRPVPLDVNAHCDRIGFRPSGSGSNFVTNDVFGNGNRLAVDTQGDVIQHRGAQPEVDIATLTMIARVVLQDSLGLVADPDNGDELRRIAEAVVAEAADKEVDHGRLRQLGASLHGVFGKVAVGAAGGTLAQLLGPPLLHAIGAQ